jgi:hypothetical protein
MPRGVSPLDEARLQGRLWTPAQMLPSLWLDGADLSTLSMSGSSVTQWRDKSGNARHAATTVRNPGITRVNDLNVINFTASGATRLDTPDFNIAPNRQFCTFAVVSGAGLLGGSTYRRIFVAKGVNPDTLSGGATYAQGYLGSGASAGTAMQIAGGSGISTPIVTGLGTGPQLLTGAFGTAGLAANVNSISANGGARSVLTGQTGALSTTGIRVGSDVSTASTSAWNGWIAEFIMTLALSFPQVQAIEGYLAWKWGLVANLPAAHPFKNRPPLIGD